MLKLEKLEEIVKPFERIMIQFGKQSYSESKKDAFKEHTINEKETGIFINGTYISNFDISTIIGYNEENGHITKSKTIFSINGVYEENIYIK